MAESSRGRGGGQGALVSIRCHLEWLDVVKELLGAENMRTLRQSCFGHLFDIGDIQFQGQLYHILVRNHLILTIKNRLSFNINGRLHEFGLVEFGLMTGLKFSGWYEPPTSSTIHSLFFTNRRSLRFTDISVAFRRECEKTAGRSLYALKLAFLFVLYVVVLPHDHKEKKIEMRYLHLADDLKRFQEYPWGRVSYDYLVRATLSRQRLVDKILREEKCMAYDVFGVVFARQTWVYEFMPDLGRDCAHMIKRNSNRFPRILRWRVDDFYTYDHLIGYFTPEYTERLGIVSPSSREWEALQELELAQRHMSPPKLILNPQAGKRKGCEVDAASGEGKKQRVEPESGLKDRLRSARLKDKGKKGNADSTGESQSIPKPAKRTANAAEEIVTNVPLPELNAQMRGLMRKIDLVLSLIRRCKCCWKSIGEVEAEDLNEGKGDLNEVKGDVDCDGSGFVEKNVEEEKDTVAAGEALVDECEGDGLAIGKSEMLFEILKPASSSPKKRKMVAHGSRSAGRSVGTRSSKRLSKTPVKASDRQLIDEELFVDEARTPQLSGRNNAGPSGTKSVTRELFATSKDRMYDTLDATFHAKNTKAFEVWYDAAKLLIPEPETPLPLVSKPSVTASWFDSLWGRKEWLWDEHIDALTNLLLWKFKRAKEMFVSGWAAMDSIGTGYLMHGDFEKTWSSMKHYVNGVWPREGGLRWIDARQVLGVANICGNHWVCYAICFESQTVTIYDSQLGQRNWSTVASHFDNMIRYVSWLCANAGIWEAKKMGSELREVWELVSAKDPPQQFGNYNCGIMALKFMECLASNHDMTTVHPARCGFFRQSYCAQLFELGREFPAEPCPPRNGVKSPKE